MTNTTSSDDFLKGGFTLIEVLISMTIIGIIAGTAVIKTDIFGTGSEQEFQQIISFLRLQHARTLRRNSSLTLTFNASNNRISVRNNSGNLIDRLHLDQWDMNSSVKDFSISSWQTKRQTVKFQNSRNQNKTIRTDLSTGFKVVENAR